MGGIVERVLNLSWDIDGDITIGGTLSSPSAYACQGIALAVTSGGAAQSLVGAHVYLVWRHRQSLRRGCVEFEMNDRAGGTCHVWWPAWMAECEGVAECQILVSLADGAVHATETFEVVVDAALIVGVDCEPHDGFTLFVSAIKRYEGAVSAGLDAAVGAVEAAELASKCARDAHEGADAAWKAADKADEAAEYAKEVADALASSGGGSGSGSGVVGPQGPKGDKGDKGDPGKDGVSVTHSWSGTKLTLTSASGTTTTDLQGPKGDTGAQGPQGEKGDPGEGTADLSAYATKTYVDEKIAGVEAGDVDLSAYATKTYVDEKVAAVPEPDLSTYATKTYVDDAVAAVPSPDLTGYATETYVDNKVAAIEVPSLVGYATTAYVDEKVAAVSAPDLSSYATQEWTKTYVAQQLASLTNLDEVSY